MIYDIYARISDDKKTGSDLEGENVADQIEICTDWITNRGGQVGTVYRDDSISATSGVTRPGFERMLTDQPRPVVYLKQSRLERKPGDLDRFLLSAREGYGVDGSRATLESASAELMARMQSLYNYYEQRNKAEFQKAANLRLAKAGKYRGSIRPFGQLRTGEWVPDEAEAVQEAAERLITGEWSFYHTAKVWNERGLHPPRTGRQGGKPWASGPVSLYFSRPRLYGYQAYGDELYELKNWRALLTREQFEAIQAIRESKKTGKRGVSLDRGDVQLLTNILKCSECGRGFNTAYRGSGNQCKRAYRCPTAGHTSISAAVIEDHVDIGARALLSAQDRSEQTAKAAERTQKLSELNTARVRAIREHEAWMDEAASAHLSPRIIAKTEDAHEAALADLDERIMALREDVSRIVLPINAGGFIIDPGQGSLLTMDREAARSVLKALYTGIRITKASQGQRSLDGRIIEDLTPWGKELAERWHARKR